MDPPEIEQLFATVSDTGIASVFGLPTPAAYAPLAIKITIIIAAKTTINFFITFSIFIAAFTAMRHKFFL
jgi:hypothetical protein